MTHIAYHASHEQFAPSNLLRLAQRAEKAGFDSLFSSDHFQPWSEAQGQAGFSWAWMGAALAATNLPAGMICCPGYRYHAAVVAQAAATLAEMFPERYWLALGSGEAHNECITALPWPPKEERNRILQESAEIMRALWRGETVSREGVVRVEKAKLYTLPGKAPLLVGAALTETTAEWLGGWADGLITTSRPPEDTRRIIEAFHRGGGEGKPLFLKVGLAWAESEAAARGSAHEQWRAVAFGSEFLSGVRTPAQAEAMGRRISPEALGRSIRISGNLQQHIDWLGADLEFGFEEIILHNVATNQEEFIDCFGLEVLPQLDRSQEYRIRI